MLGNQHLFTLLLLHEGLSCITTPFTRRKQSLGLNEETHTVGVQWDC